MGIIQQGLTGRLPQEDVNMQMLRSKHFVAEGGKLWSLAKVEDRWEVTTLSSGQYILIKLGTTFAKKEAQDS